MDVIIMQSINNNIHNFFQMISDFITMCRNYS